MKYIKNIIEIRINSPIRFAGYLRLAMLNVVYMIMFGSATALLPTESELWALQLRSGRCRQR